MQKYIQGIALGAWLGLLFSPVSSAVEYSFEGDVKAAAHHDDNISLAVDGGESIGGTVFTPKGALSVRTETLEAMLDVELNFSNYNDERFDSDDQAMRFELLNTGEHYRLGLDGSAIHDTTRTSESEDSGRVGNDRRDRYTIAPYWELTVNERNLLTVKANAKKSDFEGDRYFSFEEYGGELLWTYIVNEKTRIYANVNASKTEYDERDAPGLIGVIGVNPDGSLRLWGFPTHGGDFGPPIGPTPPTDQTFVRENEGFGFQIGGLYQWSEKLSFNGMFGSSDNDESYTIEDPHLLCVDPQYYSGGSCVYDGLESDNSVETISANMDWKDERASFNFAYLNQAQPSSDGYLLESQKAEAQWKYKTSKLSVIKVKYVWGDNERLGGGVSSNIPSVSDRNYETVAVNYWHRLNKNWFASLGLRYRNQERELIGKVAESYSGRLTLRYKPDEVRW